MVLLIKKEKIKRVMKGIKLANKNKLDFYLYPQPNLTNEEKKNSINIMLIGETGVGKSTWLHCLLNYIQNIELEENNRYFLFDEIGLEAEYEKKYGKKPFGASVTNNPTIYNIEPTNIYKYPIRIIDTPGFGDSRGPKNDQKIFSDIKNLIESGEIKSLNTICLVLKTSETRASELCEMMINNIISLFGKNVISNIIFIFTFSDNPNFIPVLESLKNHSPFYQILEKIPYYSFDALAYFMNNKEEYLKKIYENNTVNFASFLKHMTSLQSFSLK